VIEHVVNAVSSASLIDEVVLAISDKPTDDELAGFGRSLGVRVYRGSEHDVLGRFRGALEGDNADVVVRHVGDAPLVDPAIINSVIGEFLKGGCDYTSNMVERSFPRGMESEVFSREALELSHRDGMRPEDREHVTIYMRTHPDRFRSRNVRALPQDTWPDLRLTLDTEVDFQLMTAIFDALYQPGQILRSGAVIAWLREHPDIATINAHQEQKLVLGRSF
jgi:spore coat polysaccharide biosynthesis protein SpsF